jgi:hypothetical protein
MDYKKGDRIKHPKMAAWGTGLILEDSNAGIVRAFFVGAGEKKLSLQYVKPIIVTGEEAKHPLLNKMEKAAENPNTKPGKYKYQSLSESISFFLKQYQDGFYGKAFLESERDYKIKAHTLARELLNKDKFDKLIDFGQYDVAANYAKKIADKTNLIFPNEKMSLKDGLISVDNQKIFSVTLRDLLYGDQDLKTRFESFAAVLEEIKASKWTIASYYLFIFFPEKYMFVKPTVTQNTAEICGFEINYKSQLNWLTYKSVLDFSNYLFQEISVLKPRDMIDVQSFMWCISPEMRK